MEAEKLKSKFLDMTPARQQEQITKLRDALKQQLDQEEEESEKIAKTLREKSSSILDALGLKDTLSPDLQAQLLQLQVVVESRSEALILKRETLSADYTSKITAKLQSLGIIQDRIQFLQDRIQLFDGVQKTLANMQAEIPRKIQAIKQGGLNNNNLISILTFVYTSSRDLITVRDQAALDAIPHIDDKLPPEFTDIETEHQGHLEKLENEYQEFCASLTDITGDLVNSESASEIFEIGVSSMEKVIIKNIIPKFEVFQKEMKDAMEAAREEKRQVTEIQQLEEEQARGIARYAEEGQTQEKRLAEMQQLQAQAQEMARRKEEGQIINEGKRLAEIQQLEEERARAIARYAEERQTLATEMQQLLRRFPQGGGRVSSAIQDINRDLKKNGQMLNDLGRVISSHNRTLQRSYARQRAGVRGLQRSVDSFRTNFNRNFDQYSKRMHNTSRRAMNLGRMRYQRGMTSEAQRRSWGNRQSAARLNRTKYSMKARTTNRLKRITGSRKFTRAMSRRSLRSRFRPKFNYSRSFS
jgi:chromosome segregation ATPase